LKTRFELSSSPEEIELALRESGLVSLVLSSQHVDEILMRQAEKIEALHSYVLTLENAATTAFDVDQIIAGGGLKALGFKRVVAYKLILPDKLVQSCGEWKKNGEQIEYHPYLDSFFAEPRKPEEGEAMAEVIETGKYVLVQDPAQDPRCKARPNLGPFVLFRGNGSIYMFEADHPIHPEDIHQLDILVKAGAAKKQKIEAEHLKRIQKAAGIMRDLFARLANNRPDLIKIFLICLTYNFGINRAVFFKWRPGQNEFGGIFALGSLTEEEHQQALDRIKPGMREEGIYKLLKDDPQADRKINELIRQLAIEGEIPEALIIRGGRAYSVLGREVNLNPEILERFKEIFAVQDFALVPIRTDKNLGVVYLDSAFNHRDVDVEAAQILGQNFASFWVQMRRAEDRTDKIGQVKIWEQRQTKALNLLKDWIEIRKAGTDKLDAAKHLVDGYYRLLWQEGREAHNAEELEAIIKSSARRLLIPEKAITLKIEGDPSPFYSCEWINVLIEGALLETVRHFGIQVERPEKPENKPHINYLPGSRIDIRLLGNNLIISDNGEEKAPHYDLYENADLGERLISQADSEMRGAKVGGVRLILSQNEVKLYILGR